MWSARAPDSRQTLPLQMQSPLSKKQVETPMFGLWDTLLNGCTEATANLKLTNADDSNWATKIEVKEYQALTEEGKTAESKRLAGMMKAVTADLNPALDTLELLNNYLPTLANMLAAGTDAQLELTKAVTRAKDRVHRIQVRCEVEETIDLLEMQHKSDMAIARVATEQQKEKDEARMRGLEQEISETKNQKRRLNQELNTTIRRNNNFSASLQEAFIEHGTVLAPVTTPATVTTNQSNLKELLKILAFIMIMIGILISFLTK